MDYIKRMEAILRPRGAYIKNLIRLSDEAIAASADIAAEKNKPLIIKISEWWERLPDEERYRAYSMHELQTVFKVAPGRIGLALAELGWSRCRVWLTTNYKRFWVPAK